MSWAAPRTSASSTQSSGRISHGRTSARSSLSFEPNRKGIQVTRSPGRPPPAPPTRKRNPPAASKPNRFPAKVLERAGPIAQRLSLRLPEIRQLCRHIAKSYFFSVLTTCLTLYALWGDDMRLMLTEKSSDPIWDAFTQAAIVVFSSEIFVFSVGRVGYLGSFYFWLDVVSTATLVFDISTVNEGLFGDGISNREGGLVDDGSSGQGGATHPARAARVSRVGTRAGRVVRLLRTVRLIRLLKLAKKTEGQSSMPASRFTKPGDADEADEDENLTLTKESMVARKLSDMTTRRVTALVLVILLCLPCFQTDMYQESGHTSGTYMANVLVQQLCKDATEFQPHESQEHMRLYLESPERAAYEDAFLFNIYFHNWFCSDGLPEHVDASSTPLSVFGRLFWMGMAPADTPVSRLMLPSRNSSLELPQWNSRWRGDGWKYYQCGLPREAQDILRSDWEDMVTCMGGSYRGVSLLEHREGNIVCPEQLRYNERLVVTPTLIEEAPPRAHQRAMPGPQGCDESSLMFVFDRRQGSTFEAALNACQTLFLCILLGVGAITFSNVATALVLRPIERMIAKLERIRNNPLEATRIGDDEYQREQAAAVQAIRWSERQPSRRKMSLHVGRRTHHALEVAIGWREWLSANFQPRAAARSLLSAILRLPGVLHLARLLGKCPWPRSSAAPVPEAMETVVLEKTIIKIGSLLALGFGEAGAQLIGQNMQAGDSAGLNVMVPGRRVNAIFGFCGIRNFADITEILRDEVMVFVNRIASVVHSCTDEFYGNPNKNIGDAFLLVWSLAGHKESRIRRITDLALLALVTVVARASKSPLLAEYRTHPRLMTKLPNYRVRVSFGLHAGWAIAGAIGSDFKIDASYLSPNVNLAHRLEAATSTYGCLVLTDESIHDWLSPELAKECRLIDRVALVSSKKQKTYAPLRLYAVDLDDVALDVDHFSLPALNNKAKIRRRIERLRVKQERWEEGFDAHALFCEDPDIITMRRKYTQEFRSCFQMGYLNYEAGEWDAACGLLEEARTLLPFEDGPAASLLAFMRLYQWRAPGHWMGYRLLLDRH